MKLVLINCNGFWLLHHKSGQMHVNTIISDSEPAVKIIKRNVNIAV